MISCVHSIDMAKHLSYFLSLGTALKSRISTPYRASSNARMGDDVICIQWKCHAVGFRPSLNCVGRLLYCHRNGIGLILHFFHNPQIWIGLSFCWHLIFSQTPLKGHSTLSSSTVWVQERLWPCPWATLPETYGLRLSHVRKYYKTKPQDHPCTKLS